MRTGCPMHIVTVLPHQKQLGKGHSGELSREAVGAEIVEEIRRIRQKNPTYSAKKIRPILLRTHECQRASGRNRLLAQKIPLIPPS